MNNTVQHINNMNSLEGIKHLYFLGIGGIGMSALARYFVSKGCVVSGYDKTPTPLTKQLEELGIAIHYVEDVKQLPSAIDAVVYTPAIPKDHQELLFLQANNYPILKRSDVLQLITNDSFNICVAGTHGKTTVTTMIAHILRDSGYGCNAFLGGIAANYNTNFWSAPNNVVVVEADEYDRSFLKLHPNIAVITAMDADHLDIYGTPQAVEEAFIAFTHKIKDKGCLVFKNSLQQQEQLSGTHKISYSFNSSHANSYATNIKVVNGVYVFDAVINNTNIHNITLSMGGLHNIENAIAAITVAHYIGVDTEKIKKAIASFKGVKRRFEYIIKEDNCVLIDDYAHHPEELKALIRGVKSIYPQQKVTLVFQPHLYSRTKDLAQEFAESLSLADNVILLPIYPARELPIAGVTSHSIADKMKGTVSVVEKQDFLKWIEEHKPHLLVMAGAGDIDALVNPVAQILNSIKA